MDKGESNTETIAQTYQPDTEINQDKHSDKAEGTEWD